MKAGGHKQGTSDGSRVALLDDARKRRAQGGRQTPQTPPDTSADPDQDTAEYALDLASSVLAGHDDKLTADQILAHHEAAAEPTAASPATEQPADELDADTLLETLAPPTSPPAVPQGPRGSADLAADHPRRDVARRRRRVRAPQRTAPRRFGSRWVIAAGAALVVLLGVVLLTGGGPTQPRHSPSAAHPAAVVKPVSPEIARRIETLGRDARAQAAKQLRPRPPMRAHPKPQPKHTASASSSSPSTGGGTSSAGAAAPPASSSPPATSYSQPAASSGGSDGSSEPAGPGQPGSAQGGNCNPKCS